METDSYSPSSKQDGMLLPKNDELPFSQLTWSEVWAGVRLIANATFSSSLSLLCVYMVNMISLAYLSGLNNAAMIGGIGLGFVCSNCCAYILITSIDQGVNAIGAQAFGAGKTPLVSVSYHRGLFLQVVIMIPVMILLAFTEGFLTFFGIEQEIAAYAWEYIKFAYPSFFFYGLFDATKSYLFAQKIFLPVLVIQFVGMILHIFWGWMFIVQFGWGPAGAGMAKNVFELFNMCAILYYIHKTGCCDDSWVPFSEVKWKEDVMESEGLRNFISFTLPIAAILFLDMACYEVFSILAGQFDVNQLAVHVAIANSATLYYSLPLGLSIALMTYVSMAMGAGKPNAAKNYTYFGMIVDLIVTAVFVSFIVVFRSQWADIFSSNEEIKTLLLSVLNIYLLLVFFDGLQVGLSGTLKGIGKQKQATIGMIISYYCVALPLINYFAFSLGMQVRGIWIGFLVGIVALLGLYVFVLKSTDFEAQSKYLSEKYKKSDETNDIEMKKIRELSSR